MIEPLFIQVTLSPTLIWIGFGVKHPDAGGQLTICADEFAAQAAVDARTSMANGTRQRPTSLRMGERTGGGYAWFRRLRIASCRRPLVASAFPPVYVRRPSRSVTRPPASSTMIDGAARSQE